MCSFKMRGAVFLALLGHVMANVGINCNFESNLCTWTQDKTDQFDWTRKSGSTPSSPTGPSVDHTTGSSSGWYIFIETSWPRKPNDTAKLISANVPGSSAGGGKCLSFWYHMYGAHINALRVYVRSGSKDTLLWSKTGTRGDKWLQATLTVNIRTYFQAGFY
ncbi:MAM domain-containing glycosylphosphatidylinositol anchor protein 2-like [Porites lutea]|uniref:MAM domain-containing glycosylphosphatidylinositol anchor protein 2-like n=1 Tax=Porites lutea TaxID=51062 RepID=UPI003CC699B1